MHIYSPTRRMLIGLAGLILVIETGFAVGHLVHGVHPMEGPGLAAAVFASACYWIYQCARIVVTGQTHPALDQPLFGSRVPDDPLVIFTGASRVIGAIRPRPQQLARRPDPRSGPNGGRRRTPTRTRRAS